MDVLLITDAWYPQVNGVVQTISKTNEILKSWGMKIRTVHPQDFFRVPCPTYPEISLSVGASGEIERLIRREKPKAIHISTEGPLGIATRRLCLKLGLPFTTAYHTKFPEYLHARFRVPTAWTSAALRWFHSSSLGVMVSTQTLKRDLRRRGYKNLKMWSRGVDTHLFYPRTRENFLNLPRPISLYVGRVAVEKNIEDFLNLEVPGSKVVVGDGPQLPALRAKYPDAHFVGYKKGGELAEFYSAADVFVFPSRTDTFGLVLLEALASGTPVAAYPVTGPLDVIGTAPVGSLKPNLTEAWEEAIQIPSEDCREFALEFSWEKSAEQFLKNLAWVR